MSVKNSGSVVKKLSAWSVAVMMMAFAIGCAENAATEPGNRRRHRCRRLEMRRVVGALDHQPGTQALGVA